MTTEQTTSASRPAGWLAALPERRLLLDVSLWSADLAALGAELDRTSGVADLVHFDIADGYLVPDLMFSPAILRALRARTTVPFHAHLLARRPMALIDAAATAGADLITVPAEIDDVARALRRIRENGKAAGLALGVDTRIVEARPHLGAIDVLVVVCTPDGARDAALTMAALRRVHAARQLLEATGRQRTVRLLAEGGVDARTIGPLSVAGVDGLVTDLPVLSDDPAGITHWLRSQHPARPRPAPRPPRNGQGFTRRLT